MSRQEENRRSSGLVAYSQRGLADQWAVTHASGRWWVIDGNRDSIGNFGSQEEAEKMLELAQLAAIRQANHSELFD